MNVEKIFLRAEKQVILKNYDEALKLTEKLKQDESSFVKACILESDIWQKLSNYVKGYNVIKKALPMFDFEDPKEKLLAAKGLMLFASSSANLCMNEEAIKNFFTASKFTDDEELALASLDSAIFIGSYTENFSATDFQKLYTEYKKYLADIVPYPKRFYNHKKIRVGFLSADFIRHPVIHWSWALFTNIDKNIFDSCYYSNVKTPDEFTEYLRSTSKIWRDIHDLTDKEAAKLIREDEIDILFDLSGHTLGNRLRVAAYRPASV